MRVCRPLGVDVIEDAACALGSTLGGQPAGTASDYAVFSFHPRKIITCGEGGMLSVADRSTAERLRRLREHGMSVSAAERHASSSVLVESYLETGYNFRMTDIQAAVGLVQLRKLEDIIARRRHLALRYQEALGGAGLITASDPQGGTTNFQSFWVMLPDGIDRKVVLNALAAEGISCRRGIMAAHREPAYTSKRHQALPVTDRVTTRSIILPLYHALQEHSQDRVISSLLGLLEGGR
jgi:dTDP-4-amino-4,6-dideoxygalactose transaminase